MDKAETRVLEMFIRVRVYGTAHAAQFPASTRGGELFTQLNTDISELQDHAATQSSSARESKEGTTLKAVALSELQDDLEAVNRTARAMALSMPGLDDKFRLPRNTGTQNWLAAARSFAADADPLKAEFIRRGLPENFLDELEAGITAVEQIINRKGQATSESVAATAAIDETIERGMQTVRELDAIVRNVFRDNAAALAEWQSARHIERAPRHTPTQPPPAPPAT